MIKNQEQKRKSKTIKPPRFVIGISRDKEFFSENLSALVSSGMPISSALDSIAQDVKTSAMKKIVQYINKSVNNGMPLWRALDNTGIFKQHIISLIRIGEETGRLSENLKVVSVQEQKSRVFTSKVRSALMYPVFVLGLAAIVAVLIAWFILPRLAIVFSQLDIELPLLTRILIDLGEFLQVHGKIVIPVAIFLIFLLIFFTFFYKKTKFIGQNILFRIPGIGRLIKQIEIARLGFLLGTLLESGMPITRSIESLKDATAFGAYRKLYDSLEKSIENGISIQNSFKKIKKANRLIPSPIQQLISSSEQSGTLPETLRKIGDIYDEKTEDTTKNLTIILEPILLVIVWLGVVGVALAVILPIYSLVGGFNVPN